MKKFIVIAAAIAAIGLVNVVAKADTTPAPVAPPAPTAPATPTPAATIFHGKVAAVDATAKTITIDSKKLGSKTFTVTATTEIKLDGKVVTLTDIVVGDKAVVKFDGTNAVTIRAKTPVAPAAGTAPSQPTPGATTAPAF